MESSHCVHSHECLCECVWRVETEGPAERQREKSSIPSAEETVINIGLYSLAVEIGPIVFLLQSKQSWEQRLLLLFVWDPVK